MVTRTQANPATSSGILSPHCRLCGSVLRDSFADLGLTPLANSYVPVEQSARMEAFYPLQALVCGQCFLVQLAEFETPEAIFSDYAYFSSWSDSWLRHAEAYATQMVHRFALDSRSHVVEIASNDGYLLQYFQRYDISVLGVDPAANVARVAIAKGIPTEVAFFGASTARRVRDGGCSPDLVIANNVLAHVPDLHDFVDGIRILLAPNGVLTCEFPHLLRLIESNQFDTIYHEHFSYISFAVAERLFAEHGIVLFDVEEIPTHGGSLRVFGRHRENATLPQMPRVAALKATETAFGLNDLGTYREFRDRVIASKVAFLDFLLGARRAGKLVAGYGAPAKGNTLLNYCGVGPEFVAFTVDRNPHKQGHLLPGTRIPIHPPETLLREKPDYVLILPWNLRDEIVVQMAAIREWGGRFVVPIPNVVIF